MKQLLVLDINTCYLLDFKRYHFLNYNLLMALLKIDCQVGFGHLPSLLSQHLTLFGSLCKEVDGLAPCSPRGECRWATGLLCQHPEWHFPLRLNKLSGRKWWSEGNAKCWGALKISSSVCCIVEPNFSRLLDVADPEVSFWIEAKTTWGSARGSARRWDILCMSEQGLL